ncbi:hypothetical protein EVAR_100443_1 [Eumeta japonica]|uniref:Uncharacterized protein n=1 Tax=Eumeta variegata TaxID=151549 RepID=A0A4C1ZUR7_EUMVA|nr:hypothetical protein EVAR_100443_1 [Eumeta japonica]
MWERIPQRSKRYPRPQAVIGPNGRLLLHENCINICCMSAQQSAVRHRPMETAKINQSGGLVIGQNGHNNVHLCPSPCTSKPTPLTTARHRIYLRGDRDVLSRHTSER